MSSINDWSTTAANNATSDNIINWQEGQLPSTVNNSARAMMQRVKEYISDIGAVNAIGGTANAITMTATSPFSAYSDGLRITFRAANNNTGAVTLNANTVGAKAIRKVTASGEIDVVAGDIIAGQPYEVVYFGSLNSSTGGWLLVNPSKSGLSAWEQIGPTIDMTGATNLQWNNLSLYRKLRLSLEFYATTAGGQPFFRVSSNNGSTFDNGASDYNFSLLTSVAATVTGAGQASTSYVPGFASLFSSAIQADVKVEISDFNKSSPTFFNIVTQGPHSSGVIAKYFIWAFRNQSAAHNSFQFALTNASTFSSGFAVLEGVRG
ncbi:hypothetical protein [Rhizobium sp. HT1-10]|uniref:hypothetical protein n=1 Tax=Rhizobium sp. HT1-10 TaxID=3111638 RepID=UPI003C2369AE